MISAIPGNTILKQYQLSIQKSIPVLSILVLPHAYFPFIQICFTLYREFLVDQLHQSIQNQFWAGLRKKLVHHPPKA